MSNARSWLDGTEGLSELPYSLVKSDSWSIKKDSIELEGQQFSLKSFTRVKIGSLLVPDESRDIFSLTGPELKYLLQTRTAIGVTENLFTENFNPDFSVFYDLRLKAGEPPATGNLPVGYPPPHKYPKKSKSSEEVSRAFVMGHRDTDAKRKKYLKDTAVWDTKTVTTTTRRGEETIKIYGVMMPGNSTFLTLAKDHLKIFPLNEEFDTTENELFRSGIFLGVKSMPTGVEINHGPGGQYPAYYRRCFFLVESNNIRFDLGRKSMHHAPRTRLQKAVSDLFLDFEKLAKWQSDERALPSSSAQPIETKAEREARKKEDWEKYKGLVDLGISDIAYAKQPSGQEAAVAAIFHELLGAKLIRGYQPLSTGYGAQYDLHTLYPGTENNRKLELVVEFKYALDSVVKDLEDNIKFFSEMHLLVAWNADEQKLKDSNFDLDVKWDDPYDGVTHELSVPVPGIDPIPVILLEERLKKIKEQQS